VCTPGVTQLIIEAEKLKIPSTAIIASNFETSAEIWGDYQGLQIVRKSVYPGAFELSTAEELKNSFLSVILPQVIENLTKPLEKSEVAAEKPAPREIVFSGTLDEVNEFFTASNWSDGMAIVPPTIDRIEAFLKYTDLPPHEKLATLYPSYLIVTPWDVAVNGVMAGCKPEYMPILIAILEGMAEGIASRNYASTHSWVPYALVNGPIADQLGIDHAQGLITHRVNKVIGRAMGLLVHNLFGLRIKELRMGSVGYVDPWVLAENMDFLADAKWDAYHLQKGLDLNQSAVSMGTSIIIGGNLIRSEPDPETILQLIAFDAINKGYAFAKDYTIWMTPAVAKILAKAGHTKESISEYLMKVGRKFTYTHTFAQVNGSPGFLYPSFQKQLHKNDTQAQEGLLPPWYPKFDGWESIRTTAAFRRPLTILVSGCTGRNKVQTFVGDPLGSPVKVRLPANWDEAMANLGYPPLKSFYR
jgi:hypothetical protein